VRVNLLLIIQALHKARVIAIALALAIIKARLRATVKVKARLRAKVAPKVTVLSILLIVQVAHLR